MDMIKVVILEDDREQAELTESFLKQYAQTGNCLFDVKSFDSPLEFLETYRYDADLIFLDIRMPGMTGMDVAKEIRKKDDSVTLIFITSLTQYAIEGYSVNAEDYIIKPINYPEFQIKLNRCLSRITLKSSRTVTFINNDSITKLSIDSITYIETDFHRLVFHDNEGFTYVKHQSMKDCEEEFKNTDFLRINSSYMVNLRYASNIQAGDMILNDGTRLKISRPRMNDVQKTFLEFKK